MKPTTTLAALALVCAASLLACGGKPQRVSNTTAQSSAHPSLTHSAPPPSYGGHAEPARVASTSSSESESVGASRSYEDSDSGDSYGASDSVVSESRERPGLGTRFGERRNSSVVQRSFVRAARSPFSQVAIHYNNLIGIQQQSAYRGVDLRELRARTQAGGISISLVGESGHLLRGGTSAGRTYVVGRDGQRYTMVLRNDTGGRYEVVASVDGLDVVDGLPASYSKRGYILAPYSTLEIDGFRTSMSSVAAFRFGAVSDSYAAKTSGDRNVGVIGFAFFAERGSQWTHDEIRRRETANPFPGGFARPPAVVR